MAGVAGRSGRKPKAEQFARPIAAAEKRIADKLPQLIDNMLQLADGVRVQEMTEDGPIVYQKPPDYKANEYLINRIMGKPTERVEQEHTGPGGGPIRITEAIIRRPETTSVEGE